MEKNEGSYRIDEALAGIGDGVLRSPQMTRRSFTKAAGALAIAGMLGTLGTYAYFTGTDRKENELTIAQNLNVKVVEPAWDPEAAKNVVPTQHVPKDPRIRNLHDAIYGYLFVEVRVPTAVVEVFDDASQSVLPAARTPLFTFDANEAWVELERFDDGDDVVYRFGWPTPIAPKSDTPPIFEEIVFANLVEAQGQGGQKTVGVTGYGIQSESLNGCEEAWQAYKKQNGITDGTPPAAGGVSAVTVGSTLKFVEGTPSVGDQIDGGEVSAVVPDVEHGKAGCLAEAPEAIERVECLVPTAPEDTSEWFKDMTECTTMDLSGLDTSVIGGSEGMFEGTLKLEEVTMAPEADPSILPEGFKSTDGTILYKRLTDVYAVFLRTANGSQATRVTFDRLAAQPDPGSAFDGGVVVYAYGKIEEPVSYAGSWYQYSSTVTEAKFSCPVKPYSNPDWFSGWGSLRRIEGAEKIDTSNATNFSLLFAGCSSLEYVDVSSWDTSSVTTMERMFEGCRYLSELNVNSWDTTSVRDMGQMFYRCESLRKLDVASWDTSSVTNMAEMFYKCSRIESLDVSSWNMANVSNLASIFQECSSLKALDLSTWDLSSATSLAYAFNGCSMLDSLSVGSWRFAQGANLGGMFSGCWRVPSLDVSGWDTAGVAFMGELFQGCSSLTALDVLSWDTSSVTSMAQMFSGCTQLRSLDVASWDTANVESMALMFERCYALTCDCTPWDVSRVDAASHYDFASEAPGVTEPSWAA